MNIMNKIIGKNKVLLFFPKLSPQKDNASNLKTWEPLSMVALASQLIYHGYSVEIFDSRVDEAIEVVLDSISKDLLFIGVSAMSGYQVVDGLRFSKVAKSAFPTIPIVWGGWHPTILSEQTIKHPSVDIIVRGQGEITITELADTLKNGLTLEKISGIHYKLKDAIYKNPDRPLSDINDFTSRNYNLLNTSKYTISDGHLHYQTSVGCPYKCSFCGITSYFHQRYNCLTPKRVIQELKYLYERYTLKHISFYDSLFFIDLQRSKEILREIIESGIAITWDASTRVDLVLKFDEETYELIKKSGCSKLSLGIESGSPRILKLFVKDINPEKTHNSLKALSDHSLTVSANYIIAPPTESEKEFWETVESIKWVVSLNPKNKIVLYRYTPIPGTDIYELEKQEKTIQEFPENLDDWEWFYRKVLSGPSIYLSKDDKFKRPRILYYFYIAYFSNLKNKIRSEWKSISIYPIWRIAKWRCDSKWFFFPIEWYAYKILNKFR